MGSVRFRPGWLGLIVEVAAWLGAACTFLYLYLFQFDAASTSALPHLKILGLYSLLWIGLRILNWIWMPVAWLRTAIASILVFVPWLFLACWYLLAFVGLSSWGRITTWPMIETYAVQSPYLMDALGVPAPVLVICLLIAVLLPLIFVSRRVGRWDWTRSLASWSSYPVTTLAACATCLVAATQLLQFASAPRNTAEEPFSLSFFPNEGDHLHQGHNFGNSGILDARESIARRDYRKTPDFKPRNVILIVGDALRANHMSAFGYARNTTPNISRIVASQQGFAVAGTRSVCAESTCGLLALASSRPVHAMTKNPVTLHEVLRLHGYKVRLILSGDHTNFYGLKDAYGRVDSYSDGTDQTRRYINDDQLVLDLVNQLPSTPRSAQMFQFHLMSSHGLGMRHPESRKFSPSVNYYRWPQSGRAASRADVSRAINFYDNGMVQFDQVVGTLLATLQKKGYLNDALVIITGDHGEELGEHGVFSHAHQVYEGALAIPMIMMRYGYNGPVLRPAPISSQIDIAPTILEELAIVSPNVWQGQPMQRGGYHDAIHFQQSNLIGVYDQRRPQHPLKYWKDLKNGKEYVFDLENDPSERSNIADKTDMKLMTHLRKLVMAGEFAVPPPPGAKVH